MNTEDILTALREKTVGEIDLTKVGATLTELTKQQVLVTLEAEMTLALMTREKPRRFLLGYVYQGKRFVVHGLIYRPHDDEEGEPRLLIDDRHAPFTTRQRSLEGFESSLQENQIEYLIKYLDN